MSTATAPRPTKKAAPIPKGPGPEVRRAAELIKQASDPTRLQVLLELAESPRNVTELLGEVDVQSQPALSHHLAILRYARLIEPERSGRHNIYRLTEAGRRLAEAVAQLALPLAS